MRLAASVEPSSAGDCAGKTRAPEWGSITLPHAQRELRKALSPLRGTAVEYLRMPADLGLSIEPSQVGTIVGTLTDSLLTRIAEERGVGLRKAERSASDLPGEREGYPDFEHSRAHRLELKGAFVNNPEVAMKKPPTPREPSARLTQKVTIKNVQPDTDALLILVYRLEPLSSDPTLICPRIIDVNVFPVIECVKARDMRLAKSGGHWIGDYKTPIILSGIGKEKKNSGTALDLQNYGRKKGEGRDFNEDTNFGKLKRIPYKPLQEYLRDVGCQFAATGCYPETWSMTKEDARYALELEKAEKKERDEELR